MYSYSQVEKEYGEQLYSIIEAGTILNKHRVTIEEYILEVKLKILRKYIQLAIQIVHGLSICLSESDILDIHQFIIRCWTLFRDLLQQAQNYRLFSNTT
jgi:hypothetical protein